MSSTPELQTERLVLRAVRAEDAADIYAYSRNPNVLRYTTGTPPKNLAETQAFMQDLIEQPLNSHAWSMRLRGQERVIGVIEFGVCTNHIGTVDYALDESYWGRGLATEAVRAIVDWGFYTYLTLHSVEGAAMLENPASTRVQEKSGMTRNRMIYRAWSKFDEPVELIVCRITRSRWEERQLVADGRRWTTEKLL